MKVKKQILINRSIETVFAYVTDMGNVTRWTPVKSIRPLSEGPIGVGSTYVQAGEILGQQFEATTEVTDYQPPTSFAFKALVGPLPLESRFTFAPANDNATTVTMVGEGEPDKTLKLMGPLLNSIVNKQVDTQLTTLKKLLEAR